MGEPAKISEPKPFASLSSSLLARKGQAKPAMRPQGFHMMPGPGFSISHEFHHQDHDDLGWNDMGHDHLNGSHNGSLNGSGPVPLRPEQPMVEPDELPVVVEQQEALAREYAAEASAAATAMAKLVRPRAAPGSKGKAAFTLRLDAGRHLRLRLVCAVNHRSAQQIVTLALDEYLARQPDNAALAARSAN